MTAASQHRQKIAALFERPVRGALVRPIFIRLPSPGNQCPYSGLSRSSVADLCVPSKANGFKPPVKSVVLKKSKYAKRAVRLIDFESYMKYLMELRSQHQNAA